MLESLFHGIDLHVFDVHTTTKPLASADSVRPPFHFLVEPDSYVKQYLSGQSVLTPSFDVHALSKHAQSKNQFWKNYLNLLDEGTADFWKLQVPFVCSLRRSNIKLADGLGFEGRVRPRIYLSALGWSTNLDIHLRGEIHLPDLLNFILSIVGNTGNSGLHLDGKPANLSLIFSNLAGRLLKEVYEQNSPPKSGAPQVPRHMIISLSKFDGSPLRYQKTLVQQGMTTYEQALLHSLLRGESIDVKQLAQKLRKPSPTIIRFEPHADFILSYFEYGALVFMQESARRKDKRQRALSCFSANTRSCANMILTMIHFCIATRMSTNPALKAMRAQLINNLSIMKDKYLAVSDSTMGSIQFGKAFFKNNDVLNKMLAIRPGGSQSSV